MRPVTASQTIGPFWHLLGESGNDDLTRFGAAGPRIELAGRVIDGDGAPVTDACVEIWQATPPASPDFVGWGRCATDPHGNFRFTTLAPDPAEPYLAVAVFARGLLKPLWTRVYFVEEMDDPRDATRGGVNGPALPVQRGRESPLLIDDPRDATRGGVNGPALPVHPPEGGYGKAPLLIDDPLLAALPPARRATLLARPEDGRWRWDIRLQGHGETVFLDL
jgi:protocatechuate 3,4-dioxygenase, alpha subunit